MKFPGTWRVPIENTESSQIQTAAPPSPPEARVFVCIYKTLFVQYYIHGENKVSVSRECDYNKRDISPFFGDGMLKKKKKKRV